MIELDCQPIYEDADFYDLEFESRTAEIPFFRKMAQGANGPVLEIACGTGRITFPIAHDGVEIVGLDVSPSMLQQARKRSLAEGTSIKWLEQDCRTMRLKQQFALIFSATNAMQHLLDFDSALAFLRSARNALLPEGQLIIDVFNPAMSKLARPASERYRHKAFSDTDGIEIAVAVASDYRADTQILHSDLHYEKNGTLLRTKEVNMRVFFPQEILALCSLSGLEIVERFGDYDESEFHPDFPKHIIVCESRD